MLVFFWRKRPYIHTVGQAFLGLLVAFDPSMSQQAGEVYDSMVILVVISAQGFTRHKASVKEGTTLPFPSCTLTT